LLALVPVVALGAVLAHELNADVQQRYLETAQSSAALVARVGIQPLLDSQELAIGMTADQIIQVNQRLQGAAVSREIARIKVWNPAGTVVYSDNQALIGKTLPIDGDLEAALAGHPGGGLTNGQDAENAGDNLSGELVQVYVPLIFTSGSRPSGAFELYLPYAPVQAAIDRESQQLYGALAVGLVLFYASMFPVAVLADRWRRRLQNQADSTAIANLVVLERLNRLKSNFLIRISHQFRTALVGIQGFSELMRDSEELNLHNVKAFASDIYNEAEQLDRAFSQMIELDRMETGSTSLEVNQVYINQLMADVVDNFRQGHPQNPLTVELDPALGVITVDREKVAQVLTILLSNATKYSPPGSRVSVTSRIKDRFAVVTVNDEGAGLAPEIAGGLIDGKQLLLPVSANYESGDGGTGLGLPIARQIVLMHGGRIWSESLAGQGSAFHFTLPLHTDSPAVSEAVAEGV
jgi:signal transduction histidine kinase